MLVNLNTSRSKSSWLSKNKQSTKECLRLSIKSISINKTNLLSIKTSLKSSIECILSNNKNIMKNIIISLCTSKHTSQTLRLWYNQNLLLRSSSQKLDLQLGIRSWENQFTCRNNLLRCMQCLSKLQLSSSITLNNIKLQLLSHTNTNNQLMMLDLLLLQENRTFHLNHGTPNTLNLNSMSKLKMRSIRNLREERLTISSWRTEVPS